jgi:hypothetical protein
MRGREGGGTEVSCALPERTGMLCSGPQGRHGRTLCRHRHRSSMGLSGTEWGNWGQCRTEMIPVTVGIGYEREKERRENEMFRPYRHIHPAVFRQQIPNIHHTYGTYPVVWGSRLWAIRGGSPRRG